MCSTAITSANYSNNFFFVFALPKYSTQKYLKDFLSNTSYHFINNNNRSPTLYTVTKPTHFSKTADFVTCIGTILCLLLVAVGKALSAKSRWYFFIDV